MLYFASSNPNCFLQWGKTSDSFTPWFWSSNGEFEAQSRNWVSQKSQELWYLWKKKLLTALLQNSWSSSRSYRSSSSRHAHGSDQNPTTSPTPQHGRSTRHSKIPKRSTCSLYRVERRRNRCTVSWCLVDRTTARYVPQLPHILHFPYFNQQKNSSFSLPIIIIIINILP